VVSTVEEGGQEEGIGVVIGGLASASIGPRSWRRSPWEVGSSRFELPR
jgi:hypothetical protein